LFHYIGSKKDLFLFLCDYTISKIKEDLFGQINMKEKDLLERFRQTALVKVDLLYKYPELFNFALNALYSQSAEIKDEMNRIMKDASSLRFQKLFEDIDESKFRQDLEASKIKNLIIWALNGYSDSLSGEYIGKDLGGLDYGRSLEEFDAYLKIIRKCFYR
jgi:AcrR family transcriptional regulator